MTLRTPAPKLTLILYHRSLGMEDMDRVLTKKNGDKRFNEKQDKEAGDVQMPLSLKG